MTYPISDEAVKVGFDAQFTGRATEEDVRLILAAAIPHLDTDSLPPFAWRRLSELQTLVAEGDAQIKALEEALRSIVREFDRGHGADVLQSIARAALEKSQ